VVARQRADGAEVGQRQQSAGAALHQRLRALRERREAVARDVVSNPEALAAHGVDVAAFELIGRRERDRVNEDVEAVRPAPGELTEARVDLSVVRDVERQHEVAAELCGEAAHALGELVGLVRERELGAFALHGLCDAPGDRAIARDADDQGALTGEKTHRYPSSCKPGSIRRMGGASKNGFRHHFSVGATRRRTVVPSEKWCLTPFFPYVLCSSTFTCTISRSPGCRYCDADSASFHSSSCGTVTRNRCAIEYSESPLRTT